VHSKARAPNAPWSSSGTFDGFRRSIVGFLDAVRFTLTSPPSHDGACDVMTFDLVLLDFSFLFCFISLSTRHPESDTL